MATPIVKHATLTGASANPAVLVDGPKWDAEHTITGLENVDNVSDLAKPISAATQAALDLKINLAAIATKSDQQTATSTATFVSPSQQQSHPSATKAWAYYSNSGTTYTKVAGYNIASITRNSAGVLSVTLTTAFASAAFAVNASSDSLTLVATSFPASASTLTVKITNLSGVATDGGFSFSAFGAQ